MDPTSDLSETDVEKKIWKRKRLRFIAGIVNIHSRDSPGMG